MIYVTKFTDKFGDTYMRDEDRITAISFADAEEQASRLGLEVVGRLIQEQILDDDMNAIETIDYDNIQNN